MLKETVFGSQPETPSGVVKDSISVSGARQNNLAGFDVELPLGKLIVVTGPSGSGKSSFAFDTVYAEGQRRYVETFSPYTRQFLERMDKPRVDGIDGIPPSIAIEQSNHVKSTRSTVGTITEINDYLKALLPKIAEGFCPSCGQAVSPETAETIVAKMLAQFSGEGVSVVFPFVAGKGAIRGAAKVRDFFSFLNSQGYLRILVGGEVVRTDAESVPAVLPERIEVLQDRVGGGGEGREKEKRLVEAVETALRFGQGKVAVIGESSGLRQPFSTGWHCAHCDRDMRPPTPALFSFNNPQGACPECRGFGRTIGIDYQKVIPDRGASIAEGLVRPFQSGFSAECQQDLLRHCGKRGIDIDLPFNELPEDEQKFVLDGEGKDSQKAWEDGDWYGVKGYFEWLESRTYKMHVRVLLSRYRAYRLCPACGGGRYCPDTTAYRFQIPGGKKATLPELAAMPVRELEETIEGMKMPLGDASCTMLREQICKRLNYLNQVGLGYLTLDRPSRSLSGGEMERVNLTSCLGASLVNTLFVMDEPSVGLHPRDVGQLIGVMEGLRDKGNTLIVVEHEEAIIRSADHLVDIGPGRGVLGGNLVYSGEAAGIRSCEGSLTADYLFGKKSIPVPKKRKKPTGFIGLKGVNHHNLKRLDVRFPTGVFCCVTGVSGSGKSSLVNGVLYRNLDLNPLSEEEAPGYCKEVDCPLEIEEAVMVDQSPLSKTPRSTPAVYLGVFDEIRAMFGASEGAVSAGFTASSFSFNSGNGRCERCLGLGFEKVEMQFLSDLFLRCPECEGKRYRKRLLDVRVGGKSVDEVLEMTAAEAVLFFEGKEKRKEITGPLRLLAEVGLDYLRLGQPVNTLSGGESQRLKLVRRLLDQKLEKTGALLIFDEPTTGLHFDDVRLLLGVFRRLVDEGYSIIVVEHNLEVIKSADYLIDLGPEAGDLGGKIVAEGTPEEVARCEGSHTGRFLREVLRGGAVAAEWPVAKEGGKSKLAGIEIAGAREHNLKNISLQIPRDEIVVVTGLSGSGKSTLAFDLVFAEGQRRFLDSMSPYARQFIDQLEKPEVDKIEGLPPTVAIEQRVTRGGGKSTVATVTEVYHFLRLLFAKLGVQHCPDCGVEVQKNTLSAVLARAEKLLAKGGIRVFAPVVKGRKGFHTEVARWAEKQGFRHLLVDGALISVGSFTKLERFKEHTIDVLLGDVGKGDDLEEVLRRAVAIGKGACRLQDARGKFYLLSTEMNCPACGVAFEELEPRLFSYHSPHGWCGHCRGFGEVWKSALKRDFDSPLEADLAEEKLYEGLEKGEAFPCPICEGSRLNPIASAVQLHGQTIGEIVAKSARQSLEWVKKIKFTGQDAEIARDLIPEIAQRLKFLVEVGLDYLSLGRAAKTLSGGESQRIRLAAQLGSNLCGVLYVLDEPTIGLHQRDNERLLESLEALAKKGNSLLIVEHDEDTMRWATRIIDLGPGAGFCGGEVLVNGTIEDVKRSPISLTGKYLREPMRHPVRGSRRDVAGAKWLRLKGAEKHNLRCVDADFPIGCLSVVTGVSGSGKSTLVRGVFLPALRDAMREKGKEKSKWGGEWKSLEGAGEIGFLTEVDQTPIGKTSRSTPGTYVKVFDEIRKLYAGLPESKMRGYPAGRFSFNTEGGRCEACLGQGVIKMEMSFLPPSYMPCESCGGSRFSRQTQEVLYGGKSIGDVMGMTIAEAAAFFDAVPKVARGLQLMDETGLGYLKLGQPSPTLSGGEAQRIKLVAELASRASLKETVVRKGRAGKSTLYVLEEPTIGLHAADVARLVDVLHRLVDEGGTVVVIEHHLDLIAEADWVIDIGPGAGELGGKIVVAGTPEEVSACKESETGKCLNQIWRRQRKNLKS